MLTPWPVRLILFTSTLAFVSLSLVWLRAVCLNSLTQLEKRNLNVDEGLRSNQTKMIVCSQTGLFPWEDAPLCIKLFKQYSTKVQKFTACYIFMQPARYVGEARLWCERRLCFFHLVKEAMQFVRHTAVFFFFFFFLSLSLAQQHSAPLLSVIC